MEVEDMPVVTRAEDVSTKEAVVTSTDASAAGEWQPPQHAEHPAGDEIRKQVEYYFSDENLPTDKYLLGKTGGKENNPVSIKGICGFPKMRKYKPYRSVVESLKKSVFLEVVDDKYIKRKIPLAIEPTVSSQEIEKTMEDNRKKSQKPPANEPWKTKSMMKPTGFEEFFADAPVTPAVFKEEQSLYDRSLTFETRIETAIQRYRARRKFHQEIARMFNKFMQYGGIECGPKMFGGSDTKDFTDKDATDIAALTAIHFVSEDVVSSDDWEVDFVGVAKGFLSCHIIPLLDSSTAQTDISRTTNVMRNFYNYLLHHNVCPEFESQILSARRICDLADVELFNVVMANEKLPGVFNSAVSATHDGTVAGVYADDQDWDGAELVQRSLLDCREIVMFALHAYGSPAQYERATKVGKFNTVYQEQISLEVTGIEMSDEETRMLYIESQKQKPFLSPLGKLHCRRWTYPFAQRFDDSEEALKRQQTETNMTLWVEEDVLQYCFVGMKVEGEVRELEIGIKWLDSIRAIGPSFFEWLPNEIHGTQKTARAERDAQQHNNQLNPQALDEVDETINAQAEVA